jgi:hypothetical protein
LCAVALPLHAQAGHPPSESPYHDVAQRQEITAFGGWFGGNVGDAGVGPRAGPVIGLRYEFRVANPISFFARVSGIATERTVIDPEQELPEDRKLGTVQFPMLLTDVGVAFAVTGRKTWHRIMPVAHASVGLLSDLGKGIDEGGFSIGTPFALSIGAGVRFVPNGRLGARVDLTDHLYKARYPSTYFTAPSEESEAVLPAGASRNPWQHNATITFGLSYRLGR